jgi:hypothetical protein
MTILALSLLPFSKGNCQNSCSSLLPRLRETKLPVDTVKALLGKPNRETGISGEISKALTIIEVRATLYAPQRASHIEVLQS